MSRSLWQYPCVFNLVPSLYHINPKQYQLILITVLEISVDRIIYNSVIVDALYNGIHVM